MGKTLSAQHGFSELGVDTLSLVFSVSSTTLLLINNNKSVFASAHQSVLVTVISFPTLLLTQLFFA